MNLHALLRRRAEDHRPVRVLLIGAGKFGSMFLAQAAGETLDGEGGYSVYGRLMPAVDSLALGGLPIGLGHGCKLVRAVAKHQAVSWADVHMPDDEAVRVRREMEGLFRSE